MSAIGTGPEETGDRVQDAWTDAFLDPNADSLDALVAAVEARTREQVAREASVPDACQLHAFTGQPGTPCPDCTHSRYADCHPT